MAERDGYGTFGRLAAATLLARMAGQGVRTSDKRVISHLSDQDRRSLFGALMAQATTRLQVPVESTQAGVVRLHELHAIALDTADVLPVLEVADGAASIGDANVVNEGFASRLRDYFAAAAERPRILVVLTRSGNETQKSAADQVADEQLLLPRALSDTLLEEHGLASDERMLAVRSAYLDARTADSFDLMLGTLDAYLRLVKPMLPTERGRELHRLGCFLADASADFASPRAPGAVGGQNAAGQRTTRLQENATARELIEDAFNDPLRDEESELLKVFDEDSVREIIEAGTGASSTVRLDTLKRSASGQHKARSNFFALDQLRVPDELAHHAATVGELKVLTVAGEDDASFEIGLRDPREAAKQHINLWMWDTHSDRIRQVRGAVHSDVGAVSARVALPCPDAAVGFSVFQLVIAKGPQSLKSAWDTVWIVAYHSSDRTLALPGDQKPSLEQQAWNVSGKTISFQIVRPDGTRESLELDVAETPSCDEGDDDDRVKLVSLPGTGLRVRLAVEDDAAGRSTSGAADILELAAWSGSKKDRGAVRAAFRDAGSPHAAVSSVTRDRANGVWVMELGAHATVRVKSWDDHGQERATAQLLAAPAVWRVQGTAHALGLSLAAVDWDDTASTDLERYIALRADLLQRLGRAHEAVAGSLQPRGNLSPASLPLVNLAPFSDDVDALLDAWLAAVASACERSADWDTTHRALLLADTLEIADASERLIRVVVLPTHPWLLWSLLQAQRRLAADVMAGNEPTLVDEEAAALIPREAIEAWSLGGAHRETLLVTDGAPFCLEFEAVAALEPPPTLDYVARLVASKVRRYLGMHPHLGHERRTLKIGFVNPGDGHHLLEGLRQWLALEIKQRKDAAVDPSERLSHVPTIELVLFSTGCERRAVSTELERFFRERIGASLELEVDAALLSRLRYRVAQQRPEDVTEQDFVHICFAQGLIDPEKRHTVDGRLDEWWDGGFGDGTLSTYLRRTSRNAAGLLTSRRGLWLGQRSTPGRRGLATLLALLRGVHRQRIDLNEGVFRQVELPDVDGSRRMYDHADWVVHLDRDLSLAMFTNTTAAPTIIEYSDQLVPGTPGYDSITVTRHDKPYHEQMAKVLERASVVETHEFPSIAHASRGLLRDINALSGTWALDFLRGSHANAYLIGRLNGNVGAALAYRWLRRRERDSLRSRYPGVLAVYLSLEDIIRATPGAGQSLRSGLASRTAAQRENASAGADRYSDDLLVLYLQPTEPGTRSKLVGRIIEVKFGTTAASTSVRDTAVGQVRNTYRALDEFLSGQRVAPDAPFRHKQLSLLLKAQLEQGLAMGVISESELAPLNLPALSTNLATGNYRVVYTQAEGGTPILGDAFLLSTKRSGELTDAERPRVEIVDGVRVVTLGSSLVRDLAFLDDEACTVHDATSGDTLPELPTFRRRETVRPGPEQATVPLDTTPPLADPVESVEPPPGPTPVEVEESAIRGAGAQTPGRPEHEPPAALTSVRSAASSSPTLNEACSVPVRARPYDSALVANVVDRLTRALKGHRIELEAPPAAEEVDQGPRLLRAYVRLRAGTQIQAVRRVSEDLARDVGTATGDVHITNVPARHAIGLDLPIAGMSYAVTLADVTRHPSFEAASRELRLPLCVGIDVTGRVVWTDIARMPHMLVAGTTGSGKTVFLRGAILNMLLTRSPASLDLRLSSTKPMDFRPFVKAPHARGRAMASTPQEAADLVAELAAEMDRRIEVISDASCDDLEEYNANLGRTEEAMPRILAVIDEYAETCAAFSDRADRQRFTDAVTRLAQKSRAAGIHLVLCMQRPDASALEGAIKSNILHRFALKLPQAHDSRIILDDGGAETLLGKGDMLYKDDGGRIARVQVPFLDKPALKRGLEAVLAGSSPSDTRQPRDPTSPRAVEPTGASGSADTTDPRLVEFWTAFGDFIEHAGTGFRPPKPSGLSRMQWGLGRSGVHLIVMVKSGLMSVFVEINAWDNPAWFEQLIAARTEIENEIRFPMRWDHRPANKFSVIGVDQTFDTLAGAGRHAAFGKVIERMEAVDRVFRPHVARLPAGQAHHRGGV